MARYQRNTGKEVYNSGDIDSPGEVVLYEMTLNGESGLAFQVTIDTPGDGINAVGTLYCEASLDGSNWTSLGGDIDYDIADGQSETNIWNINSPQYNHIRMRQTTNDASHYTTKVFLTSWIGS